MKKWNKRRKTDQTDWKTKRIELEMHTKEAKDAAEEAGERKADQLENKANRTREATDH